MKKIIITVISMLIYSQMVLASGFQINEHGAKGMSMAGAFTGLANDASAVYYNPAAMSFLNGTNIYAGATLIAPYSKYTSPTTGTEYELESQVFTPINFYLTHKLTDKLAFGLSVNNQYGLGTEWDPNWVGKYYAYKTEIVTFYFTGAVSYKVSDQLALAAGVSVAMGNVNITQISNISLMNPAVPFGTFPDFQTELEGDATAIGFNAAVMYKPNDKLSLGLTFRSETKYEFEGDATSTPESVTFPPALGGVTVTYPKGPVEAPLTTPMNVTLGVGYEASDNLTMSADFQYVGWSSYDKLEVTFTEYAPLGSTPPTVNSAKRDYENSFIVRAGCEYGLNENIMLRGGLLYDKNPVKDELVEPTLPDADRIGINVGLGYQFSEKFAIDFAYMYLLFTEREVTDSEMGFNGTYNSNAHLAGLNLKYSL